MQRVVVTVRRGGEYDSHDLELPLETPSGRVAELIASALRWNRGPDGNPIAYQIERSGGVVIDSSRTLAEAGVLEGELLELYPIDASLQPVFGLGRQGTNSPVKGWRPLGGNKGVPGPSDRKGGRS
ncbi:MAG: protein secretion system (Wss), protein YukD [Symbiobacteriaceae bacterium]|jgi:hypothetical protein|nr:protein secretion system (Wss), protein YukD [Symbiobacteriaceae bacterium]